MPIDFFQGNLKILLLCQAVLAGDHILLCTFGMERSSLSIFQFLKSIFRSVYAVAIHRFLQDVYLFQMTVYGVYGLSSILYLSTIALY